MGIIISSSQDPGQCRQWLCHSPSKGRMHVPVFHRLNWQWPTSPGLSSSSESSIHVRQVLGELRSLQTRYVRATFEFTYYDVYPSTLPCGQGSDSRPFPDMSQSKYSMMSLLLEGPPSASFRLCVNSTGLSSRPISIRHVFFYGIPHVLIPH